MPVSGDLFYSLHCEKSIENPPLVLIHGAGGTRLYWPPEIRRLPGFCVYAPDLPGHGKSELRDGQQSIDKYADILVEWLEAVHLRRAVFVGHSMGGAVALSIALQYPERVIGLGLVSSGARLRVNPTILNYAADSTTYIKAADLLVSYSFSSNAPKRLVKLATSRMLETRQSVLIGDFQACDRFDIMDKLGVIKQPTLVVCGAEDQLTPLRYAQFLATSIPDANLVVIPGAGHMVMLEKPHSVAESLLSFLNDIPYHPGERF